jgi:hypothetical protein
MKKILTRPLIELRPSKIHKGGVGVFAISSISKGQRIADGIDEQDYKTLIPWNRFKSFSIGIQKKIMSFCVGTPQGFIPPEDLDFNELSIDWYFNHSCSGNMGFNDKGDFVAIRNIKKGEELSYDYGLAESNPKFKMICRCRSKNCRKLVTGSDWKDKNFRSKNGKYMLPALR